MRTHTHTHTQEDVHYGTFFQVNGYPEMSVIYSVFSV